MVSYAVVTTAAAGCNLTVAIAIGKLYMICTSQKRSTSSYTMGTVLALHRTAEVRQQHTTNVCKNISECCNEAGTGRKPTENQRAFCFSANQHVCMYVCIYIGVQVCGLNKSEHI